MEHARVWRPQHWPGIELLAASFTQFEFGRHWHDELAIGVIERGAEGLDYRGARVIVPQQHIVAINPAEVHTGFAGCDSGWSYRMFYFDTDLLNRAFADELPGFSPTLLHNVIFDPELYGNLLQLHQAWQSGSLLLSQQAVLHETLLQLFSRYGGCYATKTAAASSATIQHARDYLQEHWRNNVSSEQLELLTGLSRYQLIRQFKHSFGVAPHQYLLALKIQQARRLLLAGQSCVDVAVDCGFFDQSHFSRNFKKAMGVSPSRYASGG